MYKVVKPTNFLHNQAANKMDLYKYANYYKLLSLAHKLTNIIGYVHFKTYMLTWTQICIT